MNQSMDMEKENTDSEIDRVQAMGILRNKAGQQKSVPEQLFRDTFILMNNRISFC